MYTYTYENTHNLYAYAFVCMCACVHIAIFPSFWLYIFNLILSQMVFHETSYKFKSCLYL